MRFHLRWSGFYSLGTLIYLKPIHHLSLKGMSLSFRRVLLDRISPDKVWGNRWWDIKAGDHELLADQRFKDDT